MAPVSARKLSRMPIDPKVSQKLSTRNLQTSKDVLQLSDLDLMELLDEDLETVQNFVKIVSNAACPRRQTALELLNERLDSKEATYLRTHLGSLDAALGGGIPLAAITELVGPAGIGKTQLSLMLSVIATMPLGWGGLAGRVLYIDTENKFSSTRLLEIAQSWLPDYYSNEEALQQLTTSILVLSPSSASELLGRLGQLEQAIIESGTKLVVLDSVAALLRSEFGRDRLKERQELLGRQAALFKYLSETFRIPIVVTNQVMEASGNANDQPHFAFQGQTPQGEVAAPGQAIGSETTVTAALGTKWAHCVNVRLVLESRAGDRYIRVAKAPMAPMVAFPYAIDAGGIYLTEDNSNQVHVGTQPAVDEDGR